MRLQPQVCPLAVISVVFNKQSCDNFKSTMFPKESWNLTNISDIFQDASKQYKKRIFQFLSSLKPCRKRCSMLQSNYILQYVAVCCSVLQCASIKRALCLRGRLKKKMTKQHCKALRSTAKHCKALQSTAKHCKALQGTAKHCKKFEALSLILNFFQVC